MDDAAPQREAEASGSLYDWWFDALPAVFGMCGAARQATAAMGSNTEPTAARISDALRMTQQLLAPLCTAYVDALIGRPDGAPLAAFEDLMRGQLDRLGEQWRGMTTMAASPAGIEAALNGLAGGLTKALVDTLKPFANNAERAYGGVADAFGLAPVREFEAAVRELTLATMAQRRALAVYFDVTLDAMRQGVDALMARLAEMGRRGESVDTMLALVRLCARTMDGAMHEAMQSPHALEASAEAIRAGLRAKQQQQRIVALASQALNVPTRAEVDEAFREIQALKREVRRLRKGSAQVGTEREVARPVAPRPRSRKRAAARPANGDAALA